MGAGCRVQVPGHWGFGRPSLACSSCIMPGCARPNLEMEDRPWELVVRGPRSRPAHCSPATSPCAYPWPTGLLLAGTGVPSGLGGLGSGGSSDWRSLCPTADSASSSGGGLGGSTCCSGVGVLRKEGLERRRWEELRERRTRLRGTERSRRDPGSRACREGTQRVTG